MSSLYRHYKNKDYKLIGTAKHSETLEDLTIYETLYENPLGKLWARPKDMFESFVQVDGQEVRRFAPVPMEFEVYTSWQEKLTPLVFNLANVIFENFSEEKFVQRLSEAKKYCLIVAFVDKTPVGFKLGYEIDGHKFYSWLGGVLPQFRKRGIAGALMKRQREWCKDQGYSVISTKTQNNFREMLLLNIQCGFQIVGTEKQENGELKILLEKSVS
jgi:GNAT superfamily N-acetyltransferase